MRYAAGAEHRPATMHTTVASSSSRPSSGRRPGALLWLLASLVVHAAGAGALGWMTHDVWVPHVDVVWLDLDNRLGAPRRAPTPPDEPKPPRRERARSEPSARVKKERHADEPRKENSDKRRKRNRRAARRSATKRFKPRDVELDRFAPGDAALMLLLRNDRIAGSGYADSVRRLLEVFYDYKTLLWDSGLDPISDFDAMLIATPNPYRVTRTFLAIRHSLPPDRLKQALRRATSVNNTAIQWKREQLGWVGAIPSPPKLQRDPRVVVLRAGVALLSEPAQARRFLAPPRPEGRKGQSADHGAGGPGHPAAGASGDEASSLFDRLQAIDTQGGERRGGPALLLQAVNLARLIRLPRDLPPPLDLRVTIPASDPAHVRGVLLFEDQQTARKFLRAARARLERARSSLLLRVMGYAGLLERLKLRRDARRLRASIRLDAKEVRRLLELFRSAIPQVRVPGMPPRRATPRPAKGQPGPSSPGKRQSEPDNPAGAARPRREKPGPKKRPKDAPPVQKRAAPPATDHRAP